MGLLRQLKQFRDEVCSNTQQRRRSKVRGAPLLREEEEEEKVAPRNNEVEDNLTTRCEEERKGDRGKPGKIDREREESDARK